MSKRSRKRQKRKFLRETSHSEEPTDLELERLNDWFRNQTTRSKANRKERRFEEFRPVIKDLADAIHDIWYPKEEL